MRLESKSRGTYDRDVNDIDNAKAEQTSIQHDSYAGVLAKDYKITTP